MHMYIISVTPYIELIAVQTQGFMLAVAIGYNATVKTIITFSHLSTDNLYLPPIFHAPLTSHLL